MKSRLRSAFNTRQHMTSKDFEIFYYSDINFGSVDRHSHDYYEFYIFVDGDVSMEIRDKAIPLKTGDIVLVPPGVVHRGVVHSPEKPYRRFVFWISKEFCRRLLEEHSGRHGEKRDTYRRRGQHHQDRPGQRGGQINGEKHF